MPRATSKTTVVWGLAALLALTLPGATTTLARDAKDASGKNLGTSDWRDIAYGESRLGYAGDLADFKRWRANELPSRWQESITLVRGRIFAEFLKGFRSFRQSGMTPRQVELLMLKWSKVEKNRYALSDPQVARNRNGLVYYWKATKNFDSCLLFFQMSNHPDASYGDQGTEERYNATARGWLCRYTVDMNPEEVDALGRSIVANLRFDGGAINRTRAETMPKAPARAEPAVVASLAAVIERRVGKVSDKARAQLSSYLDAPSHRAFAASPSGAYGWATGKMTPAEAQAIAMKNCAKWSQLCELVLIEELPASR